MALNEEFKLLKLNTVLNKIQNEMKKNKSNPIIQDIAQKKYSIQVVLKELVHNPRMELENTLQVDDPPQKLFLINLLSNKKSNKNEDLFYLGDLICPCLNKRLWLNNDNLIAHRILKIIIQLDSLEMTDILKHCPCPKICLDPNMYIIKNDPQRFINTINALRKENDIFNYVFNFWQYIPMYALNNDAIYKLDGDLHKINEACIQDDDKDDITIKHHQNLNNKTKKIVKKYKKIKILRTSKVKKNNKFSNGRFAKKIKRGI